MIRNAEKSYSSGRASCAFLFYALRGVKNSAQRPRLNTNACFSRQIFPSKNLYFLFDISKIG
jgi:hypothetical protein